MENKIETEFDSFLYDILKTLILLIPNAQTGSIQVRDGNEIRYCTAYGYDLEKLKECVFNSDMELYLFANKREPSIITNIYETDKEELEPEKLEILIKYGKLDSIKCMIKFAIFFDNSVWGYINLENHYNKRAFSKKDIEVVSKFRDIAEKVIKVKIAHKKIDMQFKELYSILKKNFKLYDMYRHNLRNELQIQLMILGLLNDLTKKEIQKKISEIDILGKNLYLEKPLNFIPSEKSQIAIKEIINSNHSNFSFLAGARIRMYYVCDIYGKRRTILNQNFLVDTEKYPVVSDISYSFPLFQDYYIEIVLYFDESETDSNDEDNTFIERQLILLYLLNLQNRLFDHFYEMLTETKLHYTRLISFYKQHITPLTILLDKVEVDQEKYEEKWLNSICNTSEIISAIINLVEW